jgi:hypothetical protein|tara:strand:+ start:108 stop:377 length:270 start_codon:yes stop_codon:yes gene_type:complete
MNKKREEFKSDMEFVSEQFITAPLPNDWGEMKVQDLHDYLEANAKLEFLEMSGERIARDMKASAIKLRAYFTFLRQSNVADINIERANQ